MRAQPLSVDLELWGRGGVAKLLSAAGLLSVKASVRGRKRTACDGQAS